jgi:hypothetical protein
LELLAQIAVVTKKFYPALREVYIGFTMAELRCPYQLLRRVLARTRGRVRRPRSDRMAAFVRVVVTVAAPRPLPHHAALPPAFPLRAHAVVFVSEPARGGPCVCSHCIPDNDALDVLLPLGVVRRTWEEHIGPHAHEGDCLADEFFLVP